MDQRRCPGCMGLTENTVCEKCGWPMGKNNEAHQLPVGTRLRGQYIIGRALGQGGFGITYLGWDDYLDMPVAIKEFYPNAMVTRECTVSATVHCTTEQVLPNYNASMERFLREAKALAKLRDVPEVVGVHGFFEENGTAYIIMEYVKGVDLATYVARKGGRLSPEETFRILKPVMEALDMVHEADLVHRDISPDNIMLHPRGGAKLLDFGAVRNVEGAEAGKDMARSTEAILKHGFAPAEQYNSRGGLGPWTDEYAMCATVYYCLTGQIPPQAVERMLEDVEVDFNIPGLPKHQQAALTKGMAIRAKDRHGSMKKLLEALFPADVPEEAAAPVAVEPVRAAAVTERAPVPEVKAAEPAAPVSAPANAPDMVPVQAVAEPAPVEQKKVNKKKSGGIKKFLIPVAAVLVLTAVVFALLPRGWHIKNGQYSYYENGIKRSSSWLHEGENWFFFDSEGNMATGWWNVADVQYYFLENGVMATGWQTIDSERFYFDLLTGERTIGLQTIDSKEYFFASTGEMLTGWQMVNGDKCYFASTGEWVKGWAKIDGERYYFFPDGQPARGLQAIDGKKYYFALGTAKMVTGWKTVNSRTYYFDKGSGEMSVGWKSINNRTYYFDLNGELVTGWKTIDGDRYYFDYPTGMMTIGWLTKLQEINGLNDFTWTKYYFDINGKMVTGWQTIAGNRYYFGWDGIMRTGYQHISGKNHYFDENGRLVY